MNRSKLHPPTIGNDIVFRPRLTDLLEENRNKTGILVMAPAGYGKSIAVSQWLKAIPKKVAWLSLDPGIVNLRDFVYYLVTAVRESFPDFGKPLDFVEDNFSQTNTLAIAGILEDAFLSLGDRLVLVLDDVYLLKDSDSQLLLYHLLHFRIEKLLIVLVSRKELPFETNELQLYGDLIKIESSELAFQKEEYELLIKRFNDSNVQAEKKEALYTWSEGWVLGILLAARHTIEINSDSLILAKGVDSIMDHLLTEFSEPFVKTLYAMSLCDSFCAELVEDLIVFSGISGYSSGQFLETLQTYNFFIVHLDSEGKWYRFHHFFQEFLRQRIMNEDEIRIKELLESISGWFENYGLIDEALLYAVRAENYSLCTKIIQNHRFEVLDNDQWWRLQKWLDILPMKILIANTCLLFTQLWVMENTMNLDEFDSHLVVLEKYLKQNNENDQYAEYLFHKSWFDLFVKSNSQLAMEQLEKSKDLFQGSDMFNARRELYLAVARQMTGNADGALRALKNSAAMYQPQDFMALRTNLAKLFVLLAEGSCLEADDVSKEFLLVARKSEYTAIESYSWYMKGNVAFQRFDLTTAIHTLKKTLEFRKELNYRIYIDAMAGLSISHSLQGNHENAKGIINDLLKLSNTLKWSWLDNFVEGIEYRLQWHDKVTAVALEWAGTSWVVPNPSQIIFAMDHPELTKQRIIMTAGSIEQVKIGLKYLDDILALLSETNNKYHLTDILLLKSLGHLRLDDSSTSRAMMVSAIQIAGEQGMKRSIIEMAIAVPGLKEAFLELALPKDMLYEIILSTATQVRSANDTSIALSQRESQIVQLVSEGMQNKEIGDRLNISEVTVKSHLTRIFKKLGVKNRVQMVRKWTS